MILLEIQKLRWPHGQSFPDQPKVGLPSLRCAGWDRRSDSCWGKRGVWERSADAGDRVRHDSLYGRPERRNNSLDFMPASLLITCGTVRDLWAGTLMCRPSSRRHPSMDCVLSGMEGLPDWDRRHLSPTIRLSALCEVPVKPKLGWKLTVSHLLCKTNKPGRRHYFARPFERQSHEKGNVNQYIAAGRMPDRDC